MMLVPNTGIELTPFPNEKSLQNNKKILSSNDLIKC